MKRRPGGRLFCYKNDRRERSYNQNAIPEDRMRYIASLAIVFFLTLSAAAQSERPAVAPQNNTVVVGADGKYEAAPDTAMLQFNIAAQESTSEAAYASASK